ncbi:MAG TPA: hypothetical protein DF613_12815 [Lachnospiraceae bacterium]|nr:hypothetical protein [Lachnospiraceae bacterium]
MQGQGGACLGEISMIKRLQMRLTGFCAVVSALILTAMSLLCLHISGENMEQNEYHTFENSVYSIISYLESQSVISHEWVLRMESSHDLALWLYDNGKPLLINSLPSASHEKKPAHDTALADLVIAEAQKKKGLNILSLNTSYTLTQHTEFIFTAGNERYYASALLIPGKKASLGAVVLHPLTAQTAQIRRQRRDFLAAALLALAALTVFFWFFTGAMLRPVEESRKKQARFVAAASHELRTPLAVILSSAACLQEFLDEEKSPANAEPSDPDVSAIARGASPQRFLDAIFSESRRMNHLVQDMLQLAGMDVQTPRLHLQPTPLDTLLLDACEKYEPLAAKKDIRLTVSLPDDALPDCLCDRERILQSLAVLIDNALSYTPAGGMVRLALAMGHRHFTITVSDTGPGIPDKDKEAVFERFYRAESSRSDKAHYGLGLPIARDIVRQHGGRLAAADAPEGGAVFVLELPLRYK